MLFVYKGFRGASWDVRVGNLQESKRCFSAAFNMCLIWLIYDQIVLCRTKLIKLISTSKPLQKVIGLTIM